MGGGGKGKRELGLGEIVADLGLVISELSGSGVALRSGCKPSVQLAHSSGDQSSVKTDLTPREKRKKERNP